MTLPKWTTACPDWRERIVAGKSLLPCGPLFPAEAAFALDYFQALTVVDVLGKPTFGEIARPWVYDLPTALFGALNPDTGRREINRFFELISKKNGKSTKAAGIMLTALLLNDRASAAFTILAPTIEIAKNSADPAMDMVNEDPELRRYLRPIAHERTIRHLHTNATLKIVAADSETVGGSKATGVLIDELWLFGKRANAKNMFREAMGGLKSRPEGFVIALSTQSDEPPAGVFKEWLDRFRGIRDGTIVAPRSLGLLYEFPEEMLKARAYEDPRHFYITNPNLGASVDQQSIMDDFEESHREGDKSFIGFCAKHLNVEIGLTLGSNAWAGAPYWLGAADKTLTLEALLERSEVAVIGIDGGGLDDLLGLAVIGRCKVTRQWLLWNHAWAHDDVFKRKEIAPALEDFINDEDLTLCVHPTQDVEEVADIVEKVREAGLLPAKAGVGCDPVGVSAIVDELALREITGEQIVAVPQGFRLNSAAEGIPRKLKDGTFVHGGRALMAWCIGNAKVEQRGNAVLITKQISGKAKIDPLIATLNAAMLMSRNPEAPRPPSYQMLIV